MYYSVILFLSCLILLLSYLKTKTDVIESYSPSSLFTSDWNLFKQQELSQYENVNLYYDASVTPYRQAQVDDMIKKSYDQSKALTAANSNISTFCNSSDPSVRLDSTMTTNPNFSYCPNKITRYKEPTDNVYTVSTNVLVPSNYNLMDIILVGGGGAGGGGGAKYANNASPSGGGGGGGGGAGEVKIVTDIPVQGGENFIVIVGKGGVPGKGSRYTHNNWEKRGGWKFASYPFTDNGTVVLDSAPDGTSSAITYNGSGYIAEGGKGGQVGRNQVAGEGPGFHKSKTKAGDGGKGGTSKSAAGLDGGDGNEGKPLNFGSGGGGYDYNGTKYGSGGNGGAGSWPNKPKTQQGKYSLEDENGEYGSPGQDGIVIVTFKYLQSRDTNNQFTF